MTLKPDLLSGWASRHATRRSRAPWEEQIGAVPACTNKREAASSGLSSDAGAQLIFVGAGDVLQPAKEEPEGILLLLSPAGAALLL